MNFSTGNSGSLLREAVIKTGPEAQQEGSYCQLLGSEVCPEIYALIPNGYAMEKLKPARRSKDLLLDIESLLNEKVWYRRALPSSYEKTWKDNLSVLDFYGDFDWVESSEDCLVHGDPSASNALVRNGKIILCDPRPPRWYIPQYKETDMGRILQSLFGWEEAAYGEPHVDFIVPQFWHEPKYRGKAIFWMKAAARRINQLEVSRHVQETSINRWCQKIKELTYV